MSDRPPPRDPRKIHIPAPDGGDGAPPGRPVPPSERPSAPRARSKPGSTPRPLTPQPARVPPAKKGRRLLPHRPKLRRALLLGSVVLPLLLLVTLVGGFFYGRSIFDRIDRVPVADVLSHGNTGTNYLIVGSDTRNLKDITAAGLNPGVFQNGGGERSDTMLVLRFLNGKASMMSIPRDLYVPIAESGQSHKINSAYAGGPRRLILTVEHSLGIPINHYVEVDFVSFALLVDALHGITIDFPHPAFDTNTDLKVTTQGPVLLSGPQALAYVRSRHYVEVINGKDVPDATGDLGRVARQQKFLTAVLSKLGQSRNPLSLLRAASSASHGLHIDNAFGFVDALRLALKLRGLHPTSVVLPTRIGENADGSVLFLQHPAADPILASFQ